MHLLSLTLSKASAINGTALGFFTGKRSQEIVLALGTRLQLVRPDTETGKLVTVCEQNVFATVRSVASFRFVGGNKDYLVVGSDAGGIVILEFDTARSLFVQVHWHAFGRTGARRVVPGQYVAVDPKGRAVMLAAAEKSKLVYVLNRDSQAKLTISSPLEAQRAHAIITTICALDVGYENAIFAALEVDYEDADRDPTGEAFDQTPQVCHAFAWARPEHRVLMSFTLSSWSTMRWTSA